MSDLTSSTGVENQRSIERFINPYAKKYITIRGTDERSRPPTTMRVRNFDPRTPRRRSANSFNKLRESTKKSATNNRKIKIEIAAKTAISWLLPGVRNLRSKAVCETRMTSRKKTATARRMIARLRLEVLGSRVGVGCSKVIHVSRKEL